jgi:DNA-binding CsgD family transcriptional regulator
MNPAGRWCQVKQSKQRKPESAPLSTPRRLSWLERALDAPKHPPSRVPPWQHRGMTMRDFITVAATFPQKPESEPAKPKQKAKRGRKPGVTPATIRSAKLTRKMMRQGMGQKEIAEKRNMNLETIKKHLSRSKVR